jgi:hypothetical protein
VLDPNTTLAIILGVSVCPKAPNLHPLPQCENSATDFVDYLRRSLELPASHIINLFDSTVPASEQIEQIEDWLTRNASSRPKPTDLIVFYTGHGGFTRNDQAYFLAVQRTREGSEGATSIRYIDLASGIKRHAGALRKYLILDCCFAASSVMRQQADLSQMVVQRVEDELPPSGTAVLCSSAAKFVSLAPKGERHTMFSGALLQCLRNGIAGAKQALTLEEIGKRTREIIVQKFPNDAVRPELHVPEQHRGNPALAPMFPNASWTPPPLITDLVTISDGTTTAEPTEELASFFERLFGVRFSPEVAMYVLRLVVGLSMLGLLMGGIAIAPYASGAWCGNIGLFCTFKVASDPITATVSPGLLCNSAYPQLCVRPSTRYRYLDVDSFKFVPTLVQGVYSDGDITKVSVSNTGWFRKPEDEVTPQKICITVFARTNACEKKFALAGQLKADETISILAVIKGVRDLL